MGSLGCEVTLLCDLLAVRSLGCEISGLAELQQNTCHMYPHVVCVCVCIIEKITSDKTEEFVTQGSFKC